MEEIIGQIVEGEITHITKFGAFIRLENQEEGLIHISEISNDYVTTIEDYVKVGDKIKIKVLARNNKNKLELSIKQSGIETEPKEPKEQPKEPNDQKTIDNEKPLFLHKKSSNQGFEEKLTSFLKRSEERQIDIRRNLKVKQGIVKKRKN